MRILMAVWLFGAMAGTVIVSVILIAIWGIYDEPILSDYGEIACASALKDSAYISANSEYLPIRHNRPEQD